MLKPLPFDIFELQETNLPVRLTKTTNERRIVRLHETLLKVKEISKVVPVNWTMGVEGCTSWMKRPELNCTRCVRHLMKPDQGL
ncbi:hypothetical protein TNCV_3002391 [Trichonephila clavipes]|nr:hypothetical protein TNCV_3002391 [Trichonephila clavipes]